MSKLKFIFTLWFSYFFIHSNGQKVKSCNDCLPITKCSNAMELLLRHSQQPDTQRKVTSAHCGYTYEGQQRLPKICCSEFSSSKDPIESHRNLHLLPKSCGGIDGNRIIGGTTAKIDEYPWMALISHKRGDFIDFGCGGTVINSRYVLTAAHCVRNKEIPGVRIGEYDLRYETDCQGDYPNMICENKLQDIGIEERIIHPDYQVKPIVTNDIALLRLNYDIDFNYNNSKPVCLPVSQELRKPLKDEETGEVAGWGLTETSLSSSVLLKVTIPISTTETCLATYNKNKTTPVKVLSEKEFCAGALNKDSCSGDSGGPLMIQRTYDNVKRIVQYGIVSRGPRQCGMGVRGIYTDVAKYMDWILDNIKP